MSRKMPLVIRGGFSLQTLHDHTAIYIHCAVNFPLRRAYTEIFELQSRDSILTRAELIPLSLSLSLYSNSNVEFKILDQNY